MCTAVEKKGFHIAYVRAIEDAHDGARICVHLGVSEESYKNRFTQCLIFNPYLFTSLLNIHAGHIQEPGASTHAFF